MDKTKVAIIGLGTIGTGVARLLLDFGDRIGRHAGRTLWLEKVVDRDLDRPRDCDLPEGMLTDRLEDVIDRPYSRRPRFVPDMLANKLPEVYQSVCTYFGAPLRESDVSMEVCYRILEHLPDVPVDAMPVLKSCNLLNESCRNSLAHQLTAVTAEQITAACGMQPAQLLNQVGKLIAAIYPECDPALFTIYKRCGDYIKSKIL